VPRAVLRLPLLALLAASLLAAAVALAVAGTGLTRPRSSCAAATVGSATVGGVSVDAGQLANARIIYAVGAALGLPQRAEIVALATAMQESDLQNLPYGTADSLGLFQQRPSEGWGTVAQIMDPVTSARAFYEALVKVGDWQALPVTEAAQAVQRSQFPDAYGQWQPMATQLVATFAGTAGSCASVDV
jgi:hypothetical protein